MRKVLDTLYAASGVLGAMFLVAIAGVVLLQVGANAVGALAGWLFGARLGWVVPSYAEFAGFFLAASSFLALAYTLRHGAHIRVTLLIQRAPPPLRRVIEVWCLGLGAVAAGYFCWYMLRLTGESLTYGDVSPGMVAIPLWIPQAGMTLGLAVLAIAFVDELLVVLRGRRPSYLDREDEVARALADARREPAAAPSQAGDRR